jgi:hypothetical protein
MINGNISGEAVIQSSPTVNAATDGKLIIPKYDYDTKSYAIPFSGKNQMEVTIEF